MKEKTAARNLRLVTLNLDWDDVKEYKEQIQTDFSKAVRQLIREKLDESKKVEAPERLPIMAVDLSRQTTITEYDIKFFQPPQERIQRIKNLTKDQQTRLAVDVIQIQKEIRMVRK